MYKTRTVAVVMAVALTLSALQAGSAQAVAADPQSTFAAREVQNEQLPSGVADANFQPATESLGTVIEALIPNKFKIEEVDRLDAIPYDEDTLVSAATDGDPEESGIELPIDPSGTIESRLTGVGIALPSEATVSAAEVTTSGVVIYPGATPEETTIAITNSADHSQIKTVVPDHNSPNTYSYRIENGVPQLRDDGGVDIVGLIGTFTEDGALVQSAEVLTSFDPPWAVDALGAPVQTYYEVTTDSVIQHIGFDSSTAFPVVADPGVWWRIGTGTTCLVQVVALTSAWVKIPAVIAKAQRIIDKSARLTKVVRQLGGLKKSMAAVATYVKNKSKMSAPQRTAVVALGTFGVGMLSDVFGIGSCVSLVRGR